MTPLAPDAVDRYLARIGLDPDDVRSAGCTLDTLSRVQAAHVEAVPFENLAVVGDPFGGSTGEGVPLAIAHLFEKIVERERGGYCFEINGLYVALLDALGFEARRAGAMVLNDDGEATTPANHHTVIVSLDREYLADPGLGKPQMSRPVPHDGTPTAPDGAGVAWRVDESDRPDCEYVVEVRTPEHGWQQHYVFDPAPRDLSYFEATSEYLSTAPESWWTSNVIVRRKTEAGYRELSRDTFTRVEAGERTEREVAEDDWYDLLEREFGLSVS